MPKHEFACRCLKKPGGPRLLPFDPEELMLFTWKNSHLHIIELHVSTVSIHLDPLLDQVEVSN